MADNHTKAPEPIDLTIHIKRFVKVFRRLWPLVLVLSLVLSGFNFLRQRRSYVPVYECKAIFSISSGYGADDIFTSSFFYDSTTASQVGSTFPYLLNTEFMRDLILAQLDKGYINGSIRAEAKAATNLVELAVQSTNPQDAYDILNAVVASYPRAAVYMVDNPTIYMRRAPAVPTEPINSFSASGALSKGAVLGALAGVGIILAIALVTRTVGSAEELKKIINLPILASFPQINLKKRNKPETALITGRDDESIAEALRGLRTKIRKELSQTQGNVVVLTSTIPGEGKTTIAVNLALSLAEEGHKVALVDADLRNQSIGRIFRAGQKKAGLMELLNNPDLSVAQCLRPVGNTTISFLSGTSTQKRHYSLDAKSLRRVLGELSAEFDYVIVDTPPLSVVSDSMLLCRYADAVLYVVRMEYANQSQILDGVESLHQRQVPLTGCIINGAVRRHSRYGYGYGYGYGRKK